MVGNSQYWENSQIKIILSSNNTKKILYIQNTYQLLIKCQTNHSTNNIDQIMLSVIYTYMKVTVISLSGNYILHFKLTAKRSTRKLCELNEIVVCLYTNTFWATYNYFTMLKNYSVLQNKKLWMETILYKIYCVQFNDRNLFLYKTICIHSLECWIDDCFISMDK